jgi:uncharacterized protein YraI
MLKMRIAILGFIGLMILTMILHTDQAQQISTEEPDSTADVTEEAAIEEATEAVTEEPTEETAATLALDDLEDCPTLVQEALDITKTTCDTLASNEVCYGHSTLDAASRPGFTDFKFDEPGDIEQVIEMQSLSLSPMNIAQQEWGVILMRVRTSLEEQVDQNNQIQSTAELETDSMSADPVTFVVFGDTELTAPTTVLEGRAAGNINLRALPTTSSEIVSILAEGDPVTLNGRTIDSDWLRARIITESGGVSFGWVSAELVELDTEADVTTLDEIEDTELTDESPFNYGPMQAFYFRSGGSDAPCEAAPNSGMLIQTPEGLATVTLWIDEVIIELSGTTYVRTGEDGKLTLNAIDGSVSVTAAGDTRTAVAGAQVSVPLTEDLTVADIPDEPQPIDIDNLQGLPVDLLDDPVSIPAPLALPAGAPAPGRWSFQWGVTEQTCPSGRVIAFEASGMPQVLTVSADGASVGYGNNVYNRIAEGVYQNTYADIEGNLYQDTLTVSGLDRIQGESVIDIVSETTPCTLSVPFSLTLFSAS